jgi:hypothetical protein
MAVADARGEIGGRVKARAAVRWLTSAPVRFAGMLLLLLWPWQIVGRLYAHVVTGTARLLLDTGPAVALRFPPGDDPWRLRIIADEIQTGRFVETVLDLRRAGFIVAAVFVALVLATPLRWRRRAGLLAIGLAPLSLLPLLPIVALFSGALPIRAFHPGPFGRAATGIAYHVLVTAPGMAFALPLLLWLLLMWRFEPARLRALLLRVLHGDRPDRVHHLRPAVAQHRRDRAIAGRP